MGWCLRSCLKSVLKLVNSVMGLAGMGVILYSLWMLRSWHKHIDGSSFAGPVSSPPWFVCLAYPGFLRFFPSCLILTLSNVSARWDPRLPFGCMLTRRLTLDCKVQYMAFVLLLVMLEAALIADIFLNGEWEEGIGIPLEVSSSHTFALNFQAFSIFIAMVLRALGPDTSTDYDSDDDFVPARLPLLRNVVQQTYQTAVPSLSLKIDS
ncbi:hypothetical protein B296_00034093 [Ensete ventricosum]|uniref:Uncharacterized protein n=1 Tax=Ensete ventricosum TaxID=4639 RepID=A0A426Z4G1_ENSVE|nr:hypothetical protein B296_00034093 [Ensete ventricosum]